MHAFSDVCPNYRSIYSRQNSATIAVSSFTALEFPLRSGFITYPFLWSIHSPLFLLPLHLPSLSLSLYFFGDIIFFAVIKMN